MTSIMKNGKRILAVVAARGGSKGIPRKNIRLLLGKPLIAYAIEPAKQCAEIDRLIISSDDSEIIEVAKQYGAEAPFVRPAELASDTAKALPVIQHAVAFMENFDTCRYDLIVYLEPTGPLRIADDIHGAIDKAITTGADSVVGVFELEDANPVRVKKIVDDQLLPFCIPEPEGLRRQEQEKAYLRNGSMYVFRRDNIMENNSLWGKDTRPWVMPRERSVNIDEPADFLVAEYFLKVRGY